MTHIHDLLDTAELDRLVREHYVSRVVSPDGRHVLYNYTPRATYDRVWQPETERCRGLITDQAGWVVCYPFDKFFNAGETDATQIEKLAEWGAPEITDKLDGSMIAIWYDRPAGRWRCTTRGSFISEQARAAEAWLYRNIDLSRWPVGVSPITFIAEWCAPDNRVVLRYEQADLRLIGMRVGDTDLGYGRVAEYAEMIGLPVVPCVLSDLAALLARQSTDTGVEGWVLRWHPGFRVKVKTAEYLRLHRLFTGFSAARVRDAMLDGSMGAYLQELPEEIRPDAERIIATLEGAARARAADLATAYARLMPLLSEGRKAFALAVQQEPADDRPYLFSMADNKPYADRLLKSINLRALFGDLAEAAPTEE